MSWPSRRDEERILERKLRRRVRKLGRSAQQIAYRLIRSKSWGMRGVTNVCPLANYLCSKFTHGEAVHVSEIEIEALVWDTRIVINTEAAAARFVKRFDGGAYPALDAQGRTK
jgi:hypothetical protein